MVCCFLLATAIGLIVNSYMIKLLSFFAFGDENSNQIARTLNAYQQFLAQGVYSNTLRLPLILLSSSIIYLFVINAIDKIIYLQPINQQAVKSIIFAVMLSWLFASISDIQVRFYEYYFVGGLFLIESVKSRVAYNSYLMLAILYFAKLNILWNVWDIDMLNSLF